VSVLVVNKIMPPKSSTKKRKAAEGEKQAARGASKRSKQWTSEEDEALKIAVLEERQRRRSSGDEEEHDEEEDDWDEIAKSVPGKTPVQCLQRYISTRGEFTAAAGAGGGEGEERGDSKPPAQLKQGDSGVEWSVAERELLQVLVVQYEDSE
jgi:hypothetical protein